MKKNLIIVAFVLALIVPFSSNASVLDNFYVAVKGLQKQVVDLVSTKIDLVKPAPIKITPNVSEENWNTYASSTLGFEVQYPNDFSTSSIFLISPDYQNAVAFVRVSREDFLKKILKPGSVSIDLAVQDSSIFIRSAKLDEMYANPDKYLGKIATSTKQIGSSTVEYILYSEKTDQAKFGGGSSEKIIFTNGSSTIMLEANFSADVPSGPTKAVFDKMLTTFKFISASSTSVFSTTTLGILEPLATSTESLSATGTINQMAGVVVNQ